MYNILLTIQCVNIIALFIECIVVFRSRKTLLHSYLFLSCAALLVNNSGYLLELEARTEEAYTTALRLSYAGRIWIALFLLFFTAELCGKKLPAAAKYVLIALHAGIYISVLTIDRNDLFYTDYHFTMSGDFPQFTHGNGLLHKLFTITQLAYIITGLAMLFVSLYNERSRAARKRVLMVISAIVAQSAFYVVQVSGLFLEVTQFYDITMLGYSIGTVFMLVAIFRCDLLGTGEIAREFMIDRLSEGIIAVDENGIVQYFNEPAKELFPELKLLSGNVPHEVTGAAQNSDNITLNEHIYKVEQNPLMRGGESFGTLYALVDETEHIRYMQELEKQKKLADSANQAKSAFLANMSHDIRTPINAVLGMNEMILRECGDSDIIGYSEKIRSAGNTLLGLINDILDFSKIEAGKLDIIPVDYDLTSVLNDLVNMIQPRAEAKGLALETKLDGSIPKMLHGDEIRIKQIVTNILTNAVKYTEKGSVTFSLTYENNGEGSILLKVSVSDTGIGIKPEDIRSFSRRSTVSKKNATAASREPVSE